MNTVRHSFYPESPQTAVLDPVSADLLVSQQQGEWLRLGLLLVLASFLFLLNLNGYDLWPPDEPRFAEVAREMLESGDYLVPRVNGRPYLEKPPMMFWMTALFSLPAGDVNELTARLPSVLAALITLVLTYLLARRMSGVRTALWAVLILLTMQRFWWQARVAQLDMLLTAWMSAALFFMWRWHKERRATDLSLLYLVIAAGLLTKGPPALVFPLLTIFVFYWKQPELRRRLHPIAGTIAAVLLAAVWLLPARLAVSGEVAGLQHALGGNLFRQTIGRFFFGVSHANYPWYYLVQTPLDLLPWSFFIPWTLPWVWKRRKKSESVRFLLAWIGPAFVFFSICIGKRAIYLLPIFPAMAILLAASVLDLIDSRGCYWKRIIGGAWSAFLVLLIAGPIIARLVPEVHAWENALIFVAAGALLCFVSLLYLLWRSRAAWLPHHLAAGFCLLAAVTAIFLLPRVNLHKSASEFCAPLRQLSESAVPYDLYSLGFSREEYIFYAKHFHQPVPEEFYSPAPGTSTDFGWTLREQSRELSHLRDALEAVPIVSLAAASAEDLQRLRQAMQQAVLESEGGRAYVESIEDMMGEQMDALFRAMNGMRPAFVIAQDSDWRWALAANPKARELNILSDGKVGSRHVLLIANCSGIEVVRKANDRVAGI